MQSVIRNTAGLAARFGITGFLSILFGLIFLNAGNGNNSVSNEAQSHFGAITMVSIAVMFGNAQPVMLSFPFERPMFMREYSTGTCTSSLRTPHSVHCTHCY